MQVLQRLDVELAGACCSLAAWHSQKAPPSTVSRGANCSLDRLPVSPVLAFLLGLCGWLPSRLEHGVVMPAKHDPGWCVRRFDQSGVRTIGPEALAASLGASRTRSCCTLCQCMAKGSTGLQDLLETVSTALASATSGQEAAQRLVRAAEQRAPAAAQVSCRVQTRVKLD